MSNILKSFPISKKVKRHISSHFGFREIWMVHVKLQQPCISPKAVLSADLCPSHVDSVYRSVLHVDRSVFRSVRPPVGERLIAQGSTCLYTRQHWTRGDSEVWVLGLKLLTGFGAHVKFVQTWKLKHTYWEVWRENASEAAFRPYGTVERRMYSIYDHSMYSILSCCQEGFQETRDLLCVLSPVYIRLFISKASSRTQSYIPPRNRVGVFGLNKLNGL